MNYTKHGSVPHQVDVLICHSNTLRIRNFRGELYPADAKGDGKKVAFKHKISD